MEGLGASLNEATSERSDGGAALPARPLELKLGNGRMA